MKKFRLLFIALVSCLMALNLQAQTPEKFNYQAVARDGGGALISNQSIGLKISIHTGSASGTVVYSETHSTNTNSYGLFDVEVGGGTVSSGNFSTINWASGSKYLQIELDPNGGSSYTNMGTAQLLSVPYALYANASPAGVNKSIQFNDNGSLGGEGIFVWDKSNNRLGIGTNTPDKKLHVHATSGTCYLVVSDNTTGVTSGIRLGLNGAGNAYLINDESNKSLNIGTSGTTQMRIDATGNVGINTTACSQLLHLRQTVSNKGLRIQHQSATDYWENGIGVTTKNYKFYYNNIFRADISSTDGAYVNSSDRSLKKDIKTMDPVLKDVMKLTPSTYYYIDNQEGGKRSTGFVAQDVEPLFPDLVRDTDDGYKGLVYDGFSVIAIKAIQEQQEIIDEQQKIILDLLNRVEQLEK